MCLQCIPSSNTCPYACTNNRTYSRTTKQPTRDLTKEATPEHVYIDYPPGSFVDVTHNNLGDKGPGTGDVLIEYSNFMEHEGTTVEMLVEVLIEYTPHGVDMDGIRKGGEFDESTISTGSHVTLKDQSNDVEVTLPGFYFTIYDIDKQTGENGREHVDFCGACAVFTSEGFLYMDVLDILLKNMKIFQIIQLMVPL